MCVYPIFLDPQFQVSLVVCTSRIPPGWSPGPWRDVPLDLWDQQKPRPRCSRPTTGPRTRWTAHAWRVEGARTSGERDDLEPQKKSPCAAFPYGPMANLGSKLSKPCWKRGICHDMPYTRRPQTQNHTFSMA